MANARQGDGPPYFPLGGRNKSVFLVHSRRDRRQVDFYEALKARLAECDIGIWDYADWKWNRTHSVQRRESRSLGLADDETLELLGSDPVSRERHSVYEYEEEIDDDQVDEDTLGEMLLQTPAVIVFEMGGEAVSPGVGIEVELLAKHARQRLATMGGVGLVRDNRQGFFSKTCPELVGASLELAEWAGEAEISTAQIEAAALRVAIFCVRMLAASAARWNARMQYPARGFLAPVRECRKRAEQLAALLPDEVREAAAAELAKMVETILVAAHEELSVAAARPGAVGGPDLVEWAAGGFSLGLLPSDLGERSHAHLLGLADLLHPQLDDLVAGMFLSPGFRASDGRRAISARSVLGPAKLLAVWQDLDVVEFLTATIGERPASRVASHALLALGVVTEELEPAGQRRVASFLLQLAKEDGLADRERVGLIDTLAKTGSPEAADWLQEHYREHYEWVGRQEQWALVAALLRIGGKDATPVALKYLREAPAQEHALLASVAWRADADELYDALEQASGDNPKVQVNLLLSWLRARNERAIRALPIALTSADPYVLDCAAMFSPDYFGLYQVAAAARDRVVAGLSPIVAAEDAPPARQAGALLGLIAAGEELDPAQADRLTHRCLVLEQPTYVGYVLRELGMRVATWPSSTLLGHLLWHAAPDVRHAACYVAGHQQRTEHTRALELLRSDQNGVGLGEPLIAVAGRTVGDGARLALQRIAGEIPTRILPAMFE